MRSDARRRVIEELQARLAQTQALEDLIARLYRAEDSLAQLLTFDEDSEDWRIRGKMQGVALARSYAEEVLRGAAQV